MSSVASSKQNTGPLTSQTKKDKVLAVKPKNKNSNHLQSV